MTDKLEIWQLVAGLGLFLFAMNQLESALREFTGPSLRRLLQNATNRPMKSILVGTATTAVLQSSSLVSLMVLAFVGAGIMALENGIGVIIGANLGTTATGWLVSTLGFKLNLDEFTLPFIGVGTLVFVMAKRRLAAAGRSVAAMGFLLMGLNYMKKSVASLGNSFDVSVIADSSPWQFLLVASVLAGAIQSSSAVMMITLAALHTKIIDLPSAAAMAIGADLGTTTTVLIGAVNGNSAKKRVATAHFIFNVATDTLAFVLLVPLLGILLTIGITDPLISLVAFHSLFNFLGIILFFPFVHIFSKFLGNRFVSKTKPESLHVSQATPGVSNAAITAITEETVHLLARVIRQNMKVFTPTLPLPPGPLPIPFKGTYSGRNKSFDHLYQDTKTLEGEILSFATKVQTEQLEEKEAARLSQLLGVVRQAVHSSKSLRDIRHDLENFEDSPCEVVSNYLQHYRSIMSSFYTEIFSLQGAGDPTTTLEEMTGLIAQAHRRHDQIHREVFTDIRHGKIDRENISSLLNVNRELLNSNLALIQAMRDFYIDVGQAEGLDLKPGVA